jgi:hypothetical protein
MQQPDIVQQPRQALHPPDIMMWHDDAALPVRDPAAIKKLLQDEPQSAPRVP